jgi:hypothetical protein
MSNTALRTELRSGTAFQNLKLKSIIVMLRGKYQTHSGGRCQYVFAKDDGRFYAHMN